MAKIVIDIDDNLYTRLFDNGVDNYDDTVDMAKAIRKGTPLPKGHGRLIDADAFERRCMFDSDIEDMQDVIYALRDYKTIIEADKEVENEDSN